MPEQHICQFSENRRILNIRQHSQAFLHKLTSNHKNWLSHTVFNNIPLFGKFGSAKNLRIHWSAHYLFAHFCPTFSTIFWELTYVQFGLYVKCSVNGSLRTKSCLFCYEHKGYSQQHLDHNFDCLFFYSHFIARGQ